MGPSDCPWGLQTPLTTRMQSLDRLELREFCHYTGLQSVSLQGRVLLGDLVRDPFPPRELGLKDLEEAWRSQSHFKSSMSSIFKRRRRHLWVFLGKYGHLLATWEGNNVKGLGGLKTAGPGEDRWQRGLCPWGGQWKPRQEDRQSRKVGGGSLVLSGCGKEPKRKANPKWQMENEQLLQCQRQKGRSSR